MRFKFVVLAIVVAYCFSGPAHATVPPPDPCNPDPPVGPRSRIADM